MREKKIKPAEKYYSITFWDNLFKFLGFQLTSVCHSQQVTSSSNLWYIAPKMPGKFMMSIDPWFFRIKKNPVFSLFWITPEKNVKMEWSFSYKGVKDFRIFLRALKDPRLLPACIGIPWASEIIELAGI